MHIILVYVASSTSAVMTASDWPGSTFSRPLYSVFRDEWAVVIKNKHILKQRNSKSLLLLTK